VSSPIHKKRLNRQIHRDRKQTGVCQHQARQRGMTAKRHGASFWGDENVLELDHDAYLHNLMNILKINELYTLEG